MFARTCSRAYKVTVLGGAGGIGQPLGLLLKRNPIVSNLAVYDVANAAGVAADLSHISSPAVVKGFAKDELSKAVDGSDVVVIPAGVPRKPGMTRDDLFNVNASIIRDLTAAVAKSAPKAHITIITNPVNSTVPIAAEVLKKAGTYDPARLFGVTTLDIVRAKTFVGQVKGVNPFDININVVGGHSGPTIVPLLSQSGLSFTEEEVKALTKRIQYGGDEVVQAKDGAGSATLSMAYAGAEFCFSLLKAVRGDKGITECTFVESTVEPSVPFFSSKVELGKNGVEKIHPVGQLNAYEEELKEACLKELAGNIKKGVEFATK